MLVVFYNKLSWFVSELHENDIAIVVVQLNSLSTFTNQPLSIVRILPHTSATVTCW